MPFSLMRLDDLGGARVIKVASRGRGSLGVKRMRDGLEEGVPAAQHRERKGRRMLGAFDVVPAPRDRRRDRGRQ
jgi:hypothetical protein